MADVGRKPEQETSFTNDDVAAPLVDAIPSLRLLGLDVGDRRIGIAVSDPTGLIATPIEIYERRGPKVDPRHVADLAREYEAGGAVVGLPVNMNGTEGPQAEKTRDFVVGLERIGLPVVLWDERLSTMEATRRMAESGRRRKKRPGFGERRRERVDAEAAAVILESYLDHLRMRRRL